MKTRMKKLINKAVLTLVAILVYVSIIYLSGSLFSLQLCVQRWHWWSYVIAVALGAGAAPMMLVIWAALLKTLDDKA